MHERSDIRNKYLNYCFSLKSRIVARFMLKKSCSEILFRFREGYTKRRLVECPEATVLAQKAKVRIQVWAGAKVEEVAASVLMLVQADTASALTAGKKYLIR
jgi:hypothetical protein